MYIYSSYTIWSAIGQYIYFYKYISKQECEYQMDCFLWVSSLAWYDLDQPKVSKVNQNLSVEICSHWLIDYNELTTNRTIAFSYQVGIEEQPIVGLL